VGGRVKKGMSFGAVDVDDGGAAATAAASGGEEVRAMPAEVSWEMLDKSRFFLLGAALFSGVSAALYPAVVLKTHLQVSPPPAAAASTTAAAILRRHGPRGFYRGFGASLAGTVPARAVYMAALEATKSAVGSAAVRLGVAEPAASAAASAAGGVSAAVAAQVVWTPVDVVSQRLMVQTAAAGPPYRGGADALRRILRADGVRGLYRGFGVSVLTYAPSSAAWWASYATAQRLIWRALGPAHHDSRASVVAVQGASAAAAGGAAALVTMPLDTVKTRLQVMDGGGASLASEARALVREGGWGACYRGLGPRWASMSLSAATMVTAYEFLKRLSTKDTSL
jgi:solute carrier family 25 protein 44